MSEDPPETPQPGPEPSPLEARPARPVHRPGVQAGFERMLGGTRIIVTIPVTALVAFSLGAFVYGGYYFLRSLRDMVVHPVPVAANIAGFLIVIDLFLIGATMLIAAFGFYELFIDRIDPPGSKPLPSWLLMRDLNDLKGRVIGMIVLVAAVTFIEVLVDFRSPREVLYMGAGVALVVASLTLFLRFGGQGRAEK